MIFQAGRKLIFHVLFEEIQQKNGNDAAFIFGDQAVLFFAYVVAFLDRGHDAGIGRGASNSKLFHPLHQSGFRVAGRRLGEMLLGCDSIGLHRFALHQLGQALVIAIALAVIAALFIDLQKPIKQNYLTVCAQAHLSIGAADFNRGPLNFCGCHLAGDGAFPN